MWVQRSGLEVARWHEITRRDARSHGRTMAVVVWLGLCVFGLGGWYYSRGGIVVHFVTGSFWIRFVIVMVGASAFSYWLYRFEVRKEIEKACRRTICRGCGRGGDEPAGTTCGCGEARVPQSTMKWVEEARPNHVA